MCTATTCNPWTGTRGACVDVVRTPNEETQVRIAQAAAKHCVEKYGAEEANKMTLEEMIEELVKDPI